MLEPYQVHYKGHDSTVWEESHSPKMAFPLKKFSLAHTGVLHPCDFLDIL